MENETTNTATILEKKNGNGAKVLCAVFALIAIGLGVYIATDKLSGNGDMEVSEASKTEECISKKGDNKEEEQANGSVEKGYIYDTSWYGSYIVSKDGNAYLMPSEYFAYGTTDATKWTVYMDENTGVKGSYSLKTSELNNYAVIGDKSEDFKCNGFKLNLDDIRYVNEVGSGHSKTHVTAAFVDKDGNLSLLIGDYHAFDGKSKLTLKKNIDKNVAAIEMEESGSGRYTMVFYRDGTFKPLDNELLKSE